MRAGKHGLHRNAKTLEWTVAVLIHEHQMLSRYRCVQERRCEQVRRTEVLRVTLPVVGLKGPGAVRIDILSEV